MNIYIKLLLKSINVALNNIRGIINEQTINTEIRPASSSGKFNIATEAVEQYLRDHPILNDAETPRGSSKHKIPIGTF